MKKFMRREKGFTLMEMMIVIAIVGIIAAIAFPSYQRYVLQAHRVDARNALQEAAQRLEQIYSSSHRYDETGATTPVSINNATLVGWGLSQSPASGTARYNISFSDGPTQTSYTLQAVPVNAQAGDACGTFTLNESNLRTANGENGRAAISRDCWSK